jgi:DNA-binding SARP family transcriptional activator
VQDLGAELAVNQRRLSRFGKNGVVGILVKVLGPVEVTDAQGRPIPVGSQRRRELLGRLVAAGGRAVPLGQLLDDLWEDPPPTAAGTVRTFVSELRRALEPDRRPRAPSSFITSVGDGYALRVARAEVDAYKFEDALQAARSGTSSQVSETLGNALSWWTGEPYADLDCAAWVVQERARLVELRRRGVELHAGAVLDLGHGASLVAELEAFASSHPWREHAWGLLARALYPAERPVDALDTLRQARTWLLYRFGRDAAPSLDRLEGDILHHAAHLTPSRQDERLELLTRTEATGTYTRLRAMSTVAGAAAITGGTNLVLAQAQRAAAVAEAERGGDPELTARVIAAYDVPTIWTRNDDPAQASALVETARRTLVRLGSSAPTATAARASSRSCGSRAGRTRCSCSRPRSAS